MYPAQSILAQIGQGRSAYVPIQEFYDPVRQTVKKPTNQQIVKHDQEAWAMYEGQYKDPLLFDDADIQDDGEQGHGESGDEGDGQTGQPEGEPPEGEGGPAEGEGEPAETEGDQEMPGESGEAADEAMLTEPLSEIGRAHV